MEQRKGNTMSQIDAYRRIMAAMSDDAEVVELCRKHIDRAEASSSETEDNLNLVAKYMNNLYYDEEHTTTAKNLAADITKCEGVQWTCRKASYYLTRLAREEKVQKVVVKGASNEYYVL